MVGDKGRLEEAEIDDLLKVIDPRIAKVKELALSVFEHRQIRVEFKEH
jgi:hypothetical protein